MPIIDHGWGPLSEKEAYEFEMACARAGEEPFATLRKGDLAREAREAQMEREARYADLDNRFADFSARLAAFKEKRSLKL